MMPSILPTCAATPTSTTPSSSASFQFTPSPGAAVITNSQFPRSVSTTCGTADGGSTLPRYSAAAHSRQTRSRSAYHSPATRRRGSDCFSTSDRTPQAPDTSGTSTRTTVLETPPPSSAARARPASAVPISPRPAR